MNTLTSRFANTLTAADRDIVFAPLPDFRDACGVGVLATVDGNPRQKLITEGFDLLYSMEHRAGINADGETPDGIGIQVSIPKAAYRALYGLKPGQEFGIGQFMLPSETEHAGANARLKEIATSAFLRQGLIFDETKNWHPVEVDLSFAGAYARSQMPSFAHASVRAPDGMPIMEFEQRLYLAKREIDYEGAIEKLPGALASLSSQIITWKGMPRPRQLDQFYGHIRPGTAMRKAYEEAATYILFHQRYSTNVLPKWWLAHPFGGVAHNGELVTAPFGRVKYNDIFGLDAVPPGWSDSAQFDSMWRNLTYNQGMDPAFALRSLMLPGIDPNAPEDLRRVQEYQQARARYYGGPVQGPAGLLAHFDNGAQKQTVIGGDEMNLRPLVIQLQSGLVYVGSEVRDLQLGSDPLPSVLTRLGAGQTMVIDHRKGEVLMPAAVNTHFAQTYGTEAKTWLANTFTPPKPQAVLAADNAQATETLHRQMIAIGLSSESHWVDALGLISGKQGPDAMGNDAPIASMSRVPQPFESHALQDAMRITGPAVDSIRRFDHFTARSYLLPHQIGGDTKALNVEQTIMMNVEFDQLKAAIDPRLIAEIDVTVGASQTFTERLHEIRAQVLAAIDEGRTHLFFSHDNQGPERTAIPMFLAGSDINAYLETLGLRHYVNMHDSSDAHSIHAVSMRMQVGFDTVNPRLMETYLARKIAEKAADDAETPTPEEAVTGLYKGLRQGAFDVMARMGIYKQDAVQGSYNFDMPGIHTDVLQEHIPGATSPIGGWTMGLIEQYYRELHEYAYDATRTFEKLPMYGLYRAHDGSFAEQHVEAHALAQGRARAAKGIIQGEYFTDEDPANPGVPGDKRQTAFNAWCDSATNNSAALYLQAQRAITDTMPANDNGPDRWPINPRDLLRIKPAGSPVSEREFEQTVDEVVCDTLVTGDASFGSTSELTHWSIHEGVNGIEVTRQDGSVITPISGSGEGGVPKHWKGKRRPRRVQSAGGRYGHDLEYLLSALEIQFKAEQGAKRGKGGLLPAAKNGTAVARSRGVAAPYIELPSPAMQNDNYSIEDFKLWVQRMEEIIKKIKNANPNAMISVKLGCGEGVDIVAEGCAKAGVDSITLSGPGGTGASTPTDIKNTCYRWDLKLKETHDRLVASNLRDNVILVVDGGINTKEEIEKALFLGATKVALMTEALVALGCEMLRRCNKPRGDNDDGCFFGVASHEYDENFTGKPIHVQRLLRLMSRGVIQDLAKQGFRRVQDAIGRCDLLEQFEMGDQYVDSHDLSGLTRRNNDWTWKPLVRKGFNHDASNLNYQSPQFFKDAEASGTVYQLTNDNRHVGVTLSAKILKAQQEEKLLKDYQVTIHTAGAAGADYGAYLTKGVTLIHEGAVNDHVGQGISGGTIVIKPPANSNFGPNTILIGNSALYGGMDGDAYIRFSAASCFAVGNHGAQAVIEGAQEYLCENMSGGFVVCLGDTGPHAASGMVGGYLAMYAPDADRLKTISLKDQGKEARYLIRLSDLRGQLSESQCDVLEFHTQAMIGNHSHYTGSPIAAEIRTNWEHERENMFIVVPKGIMNILRENPDCNPMYILDYLELKEARARAAKLATSQTKGGGATSAPATHTLNVGG